MLTLLGDRKILNHTMKKHQISRARKRVFKLTDRIEDPLDLRGHMPFRVATASNLMALNRDLAIRREVGLDTREMRVLINIGSYMPITAADIAYQSRMDSYTISRATTVLKKRGLIDTEDDPTNRRVKKLVLTEAGVSVYRKLVAKVNARSNSIEKILSKQEITLLFDMLERIESETEKHLAEYAVNVQSQGEDLPADQKELIRWYRKSQDD